MSAARPGVPAWIDLTTSDPAGAAEFYGALFGWTLAGEEGEAYRIILSDGRPLGGVLASDADIAGFGVYLRVSDMDAACAAAVDNGGAVVMQPIAFGSLSRRALLLDPGGALVGAWEPDSFRGFNAVGHGVPVWFELFTGKLEDTAKFYSQVFEWDVTAVSGHAAGMPYLTHGEGDEAVAGVGRPEWLGPERAGFWRVYFQVDDVDATAAPAPVTPTPEPTPPPVKPVPTFPLDPAPVVVPPAVVVQPWVDTTRSVARAPSTGRSLAYTGADGIGLSVLIGLVLLSAGTASLMVTRRRRA